MWILLPYASVTLAQSQPDDKTIVSTSGPTDIIPDIRDDEASFKLQKGDFVVVPIPTANPTLDTGIVLGGAYFYPQSEEQKSSQPASVTLVAGMYTSNDSKAFAIGQTAGWLIRGNFVQTQYPEKLAVNGMQVLPADLSMLIRV